MVTIIKANEEKETFSEEKLLHSIQRAHVPLELQQQLISQIREKLYENIPTSEIHQSILQFLAASHQPHIQAKYNLKRAIMELGPSGYPFEDFVAEILKYKGYKTTLRTMVPGNCITHEIDVIAEKDGKKIMVEVKFHNMIGTKTRIHVGLYTKARFDDIAASNKFDEAWLVTNTKITTDVIDYTRCVGMNVISWSYPHKGSFNDLVEEAGLYPITAITHLTMSQKQQLLEEHIVLCRDICKNPAALDVLHLDEKTKSEVLSETKAICSL